MQQYQITQAFTRLMSTLQYRLLPTNGQGPRRGTSDEFELMSVDTLSGEEITEASPLFVHEIADHWYRFKHKYSRNYIFINSNSGELAIPTGLRPFFRGFFDVPGYLLD